MPDNPVFTSPAIVPWPKGAGSVAVEYSIDAIERLRLAALDGLTSLPKIGMGIGGLLLGTHGNGRVRILDFVPIPCSHSHGPSFSLSPGEMKHAVELRSTARPLAVVGWYWSMTRGQKPPGKQSAALFGALCPETWQIMLVLRPSMAEPSRADLFFREKGLIVTGPELEMHPAEQALTAPPGPPEEPALPPPAPPATVPVAVPMPPPAPVRPQPAFSIQPPAARPFWLLWVLAAALLCAGGGSAAWFTRNDWLPRPPLTLEANEAKGQVTFRWNKDAVRGFDGATLLVNDGGELHTFPLGRQRLQGGVMDYQRKSGRVTGTLRIGETRAIALYLEPVPASPAPAPVP